MANILRYWTKILKVLSSITQLSSRRSESLFKPGRRSRFRSAFFVILLTSGLVFSIANANPLLMLFRRNIAWNTVNPSNWTAENTVAWTIAFTSYAGAFVGKAFNSTASTAGFTVYEWAPAGSAFTDGEVLFRFNAIVPSATAQLGPTGYLRESGLTGTAGNGYGAGLVYVSSAPAIRLNKWVSGTTTILTTSSALTMTSGSWYWIRFRVQGTTLSAKFWASGTAEPGAWTVTATDSSLTSGHIGYGMYGSAWSPINMDYYSHATGTGSAPGP